ncbi:MAG: hypothetical protein L6Q97_16345, partial [Thermoanaerobaculia bacterium]|nr:hypothetical protein [Thermoanaerobaculia bacterium]
MKKGTYLIPGILNRCLLALFVIMGFSTVAEASYTATATSPQQYYTAGQSNTFNFTVTVTTNSTFEYVDNIRFTFPAGVTISSATGPEPYNFCGGGQGNKTIAANVVTWATPGGPGSSCGAFDDGGYNFSVTVDVPANFSDQTSNFTITYAQNLPCVFNCPGNQTFNLSPGECSKVVSYDVSFSGNCDILIPTAKTITQNLDTLSTTGGVAYGINGEGHYRGYDLAALGITGSYTINSIKVGGYNFSGGGTVQLYVYTYTGTLGGTTLNLAQATQIATSAPVFVAQGTLVNIPINAVIPAGSKFLVEIRKVSGGLFTIGYNFGGQTDPSYIAPFPGTNPTNLAAFGLGNYHLIQVLHGVALQAAPPQLVLMSGLPSGAEFPIGTTQVMWKLINPFTGAVINTCNFSITVLEYPTPIKSLVCNDLVQISLDANCEAVVGADQVLEGGPYGCYDDYIVELDKTAPFGNGPWVPAVLGPSDVGKTYQVRVVDPENNDNKCWGNIKVEDKLPPVLSCPTAYAYCNQSLEPCANSKPIYVPDPNADPIQFPANFDFLGSGQAWVWDFQDGGYFFDLENTTTEPLAVGGFGIRYWSPDFGNIPSPATVDVYTAPTSFGNEANPAAWTNLGPDEVDVVPYFATGTGPLTQVELSAPVIIPPGQSRGFHIYGRDADPIFNWSFGAPLPDIQNGPLKMKAGFIASGLFEPQAGFGDCIGNIQVNLAIEGELPCLPNDLVLGVDAFKNANGSYTVTAGTGDPVLEPCSNATLTYVDTEVQQDCASGLTKIVNRKWTATDASGNTATRIQLINVIRPVLGDVVLPPNYDDIDAPALECNSSYPWPNT